MASGSNFVLLEKQTSYYFTQELLMHLKNVLNKISKTSGAWLGFGWVLCLFLVLPLSGCGPTDTTATTDGTARDAADDHDHDDHDHEGHDHEGHDHEAASLPESVTELEGTFAKISKGFADQDAESVHGELHDVGHLLEAMETKVKAGTGVAEGKQETAEQAVAGLFEGFMTLDDSLHGNDDADTEAAISKISDGLKQLKDVMQ